MQVYTDFFYYHCTLHQSDRDLPYLLMLHGFMGNGHVFDHLIDDLTAFCNPITIDLAGHGKTESPSDPGYYRAERQVKQLCSIIQRLNFENIFLYGYSMGGRLSFQLAVAHSELFSGVLIESSHCGIESQDECKKRQQIDEKRALKIERNFNQFVDEWLEMPLFQHTPPDLSAIYEKIMRSQDPSLMSASLGGFGAGVMPSVCDKISELHMTITLIAGELDQKYVERMISIHKKANSSNLQIVKNAGHRVHADQPGEFIQILKDSVG